MSEQVQPVVDCDHHNIPAPAQISALIPLVITGTVGKAASMQPDHHRPRSIIPNARGPDVQILAVVIRSRLRLSRHTEHRPLGGDVSIGIRLKHPFPRFHCLGGNKPFCGMGIGYAQIGINAIIQSALDLSRRCDHKAIAGFFRGRLLTALGRRNDLRGACCVLPPFRVLFGLCFTCF